MHLLLTHVDTGQKGEGFPVVLVVLAGSDCVGVGSGVVIVLEADLGQGVADQVVLSAELVRLHEVLQGLGIITHLGLDVDLVLRQVGVGEANMSQQGLLHQNPSLGVLKVLLVIELSIRQSYLPVLQNHSFENGAHSYQHLPL